MVKSGSQEKTILVTGGAGFIGTSFIYHALDALSCSGNASNLDGLPDHCTP
ncbi:MAG: hypothetical protein SWC96_06215 [Thermodesulfobacteriota bacterium]|nr:hypothetical protein [Thermodesulfobacteriota bacterium]